MRTGKTFNQFCVKVLSATASHRRVSSSSAEGASGFCRTMPPSERQLMSIGASEHRAFVRAKARFAGQKAQEHSFVRRNAVTPDMLPCIVAGIFWRKVPRVPCPSRRPSVRPARSHSLPVERHLPGLMQRPPLPGVSLFRRFRCYLDRPPAPRGLLRHPSPPGVSLFRHLCCYLDRPPALHGPLRHQSPPGVSLFRRFRCYLKRRPALHGPLRHPPPPGVSRFH